jgi:hypothetical protein
VVAWHSGGRERCIGFRRSRGWSTEIDDSGSTKWLKDKDHAHPIYAQYTDEKEAQFRGTVPSPIPRIIEPATVKLDDRETTSFFNTKGLTASRPLVPRKSTFGTTLSYLASPGQAFLRMTGRSTPNPGDEAHGHLTRISA